MWSGCQRSRRKVGKPLASDLSRRTKRICVTHSRYCYAQFLFCRLPNGPRFLCQWRADRRQSGPTGPIQSNPVEFPARNAALDGFQAWLCRRWLRGLHRHDFEKGILHGGNQVSTRVCFLARGGTVLQCLVFCDALGSRSIVSCFHHRMII